MNKNLNSSLERLDLEQGQLVGSPSQVFNRVSVYIDGFNLYHAIKDIQKINDNGSCLRKIDNYKSLTWINLKKLAELYCCNKVKNSTIVDINFFTAFPRHKPKEQQLNHINYCKIQKKYCDVNIIERKFTTYTDKNGKKITTEKQTDTNLAVSVIADILIGKIDTAIIISNDSDIIAIINKSKELNIGKIIIFTPPSEKYTNTQLNTKDSVQKTLFMSSDINKAMKYYYNNELFNKIYDLKVKFLLDCLLPNEININGEIIKNPYLEDYPL